MKIDRARQLTLGPKAEVSSVGKQVVAEADCIGYCPQLVRTEVAISE